MDCFDKFLPKLSVQSKHPLPNLRGQREISARNSENPATENNLPDEFYHFICKKIGVSVNNLWFGTYMWQTILSRVQSKRSALIDEEKIKQIIQWPSNDNEMHGH